MFLSTNFNINFIFVFILYKIYNAKYTYILYVVITSNTLLKLLNLENKYIPKNYNIIIYNINYLIYSFCS